jgi:hypothetical protein
VEEQISRGQRAEDIYLYDTESGEKISRGFLEDRYLEDRRFRTTLYVTLIAALTLATEQECRYWRGGGGMVRGRV